ncbi:MAG: putative DNA binding domain-containing protein [Bacteroidaceae bacterium]|nr:putative DNA binding domain-containing protein [Bacteroidaceae bacterium]MBR0542877.1 putative DNA binding domain-containing protein [Bacteroidaceae bacterium]
MITKDEIQELLHSTETYRVERTTSTGDMDKFQEAICAFANDLPNSRKNGYLILGAYDNGTLSGLKVTDDLLKKIAAIRSNGNILPIPVMSVDRFQFPEGDLLVAEVSPSDLPPVRYRGRTFIRIGPRRDIATEAEERILAERRMSFMATFDTMPCLAAKLNDINTDLLRTKYLIPLLGNELVESDTRPIEEQMAAVGMYDTEHQCPTYAAVVLFGNKPRRFMPGLYVQYVCFKGEDVTSEVENEMQLEGNYCELLPRLELLLELSVIKKKPVFVSILREEMVNNYPYTAIRELLLNACMHRDLKSNMPLRLYEFAGHLELTNAGGLYGDARPENFPTINDYRNPLIASAMKTMGYVNMFNRGVGQVQADLKENGNQPAEFNVNLITAFKVDVKVSQSYTNESGGKNGGKVGGDVPSLSPALSQVLSPDEEKDASTDAKDAISSSKVATLDEKVASSEPKVVTSEEKVASPKKKISSEEMAIYILEYCSTWRSMDEIAQFANRDKNYIRNKVLPRLAEKLEKEYPDVPNHPRQRYRTIGRS